MIQDVDEALRALVKRDALKGADVEIAFDAPNRDWVSRRNTPTVDLYLYDIREDIHRREVAYENVRDGNGRVSSRKPPHRWFKLSYLVTAWTQRPEDEHRLLSSLLGCFLAHEIMPADLVNGVLERDHPPLVSVALPPPQDRSLSDVWSALGGELKPSLDLVISTPVDTARVAAAGPPVIEEPRFHFAGDDDAQGRSARIRRPVSELEPSTEEEIQAGKTSSGRRLKVRGS